MSQQTLSEVCSLLLESSACLMILNRVADGSISWPGGPPVCLGEFILHSLSCLPACHSPSLCVCGGGGGSGGYCLWCGYYLIDPYREHLGTVLSYISFLELDHVERLPPRVSPAYPPVCRGKNHRWEGGGGGDRAVWR